MKFIKTLIILGIFALLMITFASARESVFIEPPLSEAVRIVIDRENSVVKIYWLRDASSSWPWDICTMRRLCVCCGSYIEPRYYIYGIDLNKDGELDPNSELFYPEWMNGLLPLDGEAKLVG